jgi:hypothetical protein
MSDHKGVITFYQLKLDAETDTSLDALNEFIGKGTADNVSCRNVYHMQVPPNELANRLEVMCREDEALLADIHKELKDGANYMFVAPVEGKAIKSFDLSEFVSKFE